MEAVQEGFLPDSISSDLNVTNWRSPWVFSLPMVMSKYLALGMTLEKVIECTTAAPARQMGSGNVLGTLLEGASADITILEIKEQETEFRDILGGSVRGSRLLIPRAAVLDGKTMYLSADCYR